MILVCTTVGTINQKVQALAIRDLLHIGTIYSSGYGPIITGVEKIVRKLDRGSEDEGSVGFGRWASG